MSPINKKRLNVKKELILDPTSSDNSNSIDLMTDDDQQQQQTTSRQFGRVNRRTLDKNSDEYKLRRQRNNIAVKKSRTKSKQRTQETQKRVNELVDENQRLQTKVKILSKELNFLKDLFIAHASSHNNNNNNNNNNVNSITNGQTFDINLNDNTNDLLLTMDNNNNNESLMQQQQQQQ